MDALIFWSLQKVHIVVTCRCVRKDTNNYQKDVNHKMPQVYLQKSKLAET